MAAVTKWTDTKICLNPLEQANAFEGTDQIKVTYMTDCPVYLKTHCLFGCPQPMLKSIIKWIHAVDHKYEQ